ncbi:MAG TPA: hypothetical protein PLL23_16050 [Chitinophagaceae bacterium]|nr:hypothetical protein [Chitinophagaceae bacterium]
MFNPNLFSLTLICCLLTASVLQAQPGTSVSTISSPKYLPVTRTIAHTLGNRTVIIKVIQYGEPNGIYCINMHDNEGTAVEGAVPVLEMTGGTLIRVENFRQRVIKFRLNGVLYGFDPNRIYSRIGIGQTLRDNRNYSLKAVQEIEKFAGRLLSLIPDTAKCLVALHNNTNDLFSIKSYIPGGIRQKDAKAVYYNETEDVDDIALTTDSLVYKVMADAGYNSIWQDNVKAKKDGSLSVYSGEKGIRYINIETEHGKVEQYRIMFEKLMAWLLSPPPQPVENPVEEKESTGAQNLLIIN